MGLTFYLLLDLSVLEIAALAFLAKVNPLDLRGRALHPYNVLGFLFFVVDLDFFSLFQLTASGVQTYFARQMIATLEPVTNGFAFYLICQTFIIAGIAAVALPSGGRRNREQFAFRTEITAARVCMLLCIVGTVLGAWQLILVCLHQGSFTYIAGVRQRFFADNPVLLVIVSTVAPSYILFGSRHNLRGAAISLIPLLPFLVLVGGRSKLLYPLIAFLYWMCRRVKLSAAVIYAGAPALLLALSLFTFISRQNGSFSDFPRYLQDNGGLTGPLFDDASISMAEIISINVAKPSIERQPWDSVLGGVLLPVPRSVVPFKPLGASTQFTMAADPERWALVKSEWTITGFINLMYDFGNLGAFIACVLLGALWAWALQRSLRSRFGTGVVGPVCCLVAYQFIRGDLYIVAQFLWPLLIVLLLYQLVLRTLTLFRRRPMLPSPRAFAIPIEGRQHDAQN